MACCKAVAESSEFIRAVACGRKYERQHYLHYCADCGIQGSVTCVERCFMGIECHWEERK